MVVLWIEEKRVERYFTYIGDIVHEAMVGEGGKSKLQRLNVGVLWWCCGSYACVDEEVAGATCSSSIASLPLWGASDVGVLRR